MDIHSHYGQWVSSSKGDSPESFSEALTRFGIDATICSSARAVLYDIVTGNSEVAALVEADSRIYGAITVNPNHRETSIREIDRYSQEERFVAVKLHPDYCGVAADAPETLAVAKAAAKKRLPMLVHTWGEAEVAATAALARDVGDLPVFMFHMGGDAWRRAIDCAAVQDNLCLEIVATLPDARRITTAVEEVGPRRVFFGSDMTLISPAFTFGLLESTGLAEEDLEHILGLNAKRVFDID